MCALQITRFQLLTFSLRTQFLLFCRQNRPAWCAANFFSLYFCLPSIHDYTHKYVAKWRVSVRRRIDRIHYINYMYMYGQFICQCRDHCGFRSLLSYSLVLACIVHCVRAISCFCAFKKKTEWNSVCDGRFCGLRLHCAACKRSCSVHRNPHPWPGEVLWTI